MTRKDLRTYRYQQMRLAFLADKTGCYWCGSTQRKLTIDHVVPVALMSDDTELTPFSVENWVAACLSCNAQRGARLVNAQRRRRRRRPHIGFSSETEWR
jgi:5-methylcytosine-specific restriction endonuclease McrA